MFHAYAGQARYYSIILFSQVWVFYGCRRVLTGDVRRGALHILGAALLQFYTNYQFLAVNVVALSATALLAAPATRAPLRAGAIVALGLAAAAGPWIWFAGSAVLGGYAGFESYHDTPGSLNFFVDFPHKLVEALKIVNNFTVPLLLQIGRAHV